MHGVQIAGAAAQIKLPELVGRKILRAGDVWEYKRKFKLGNDVCIEKQVKVSFEYARINRPLLNIGSTGHCC